jgi:hypothetical protein
MSKPEWLKEKERSRASHAGFKRCLNCAHVGKPIGFTNYMGKDRGREVMYDCDKFPNQRIYSKTLACESYEPAHVETRRVP